MGLTKRVGFKQDVNDVANVFKALGHPARIQIMNVLLNTKTATCGEIVGVLPLAQSTVSKHLLELKKAELINISFLGKNSIYSVEKSKLSILSQFIDNYINSYDFKPLKIKEKVVKLNKSSVKLVEKKEVTKKHIHLKNFNYEFKNKKQ
ncbi:ArsR/SmtB family transcription factor [Flavobacterium sp.]|uniref:ArsR/SmtB family transcription factor n=1 Tax=Flavobacterium sp. TaxID=239 RepID=UPI003F69FC64